MTRTKKLVLCIWLSGVFLVSAFAQVGGASSGVAVRMFVRSIGTYSSTVSASGTFLESYPGAGDGYVSTSATGHKVPAILGLDGYVRVEPGKSYTLALGNTVYENAEFQIIAPPGYRAVIDGVVRSRIEYQLSGNIVVKVEPSGVRLPALAGISTSVAANEVEWKVSLGGLLNGESAGELALIDAGTRDDWAPLFTPAMLFYEATSDEVLVTRESDVIRRIRSNQVFVEVVTINSSRYEIRFYDPAQSGSGGSLTGQPYVTYVIEQGAGAHSIQFTKQIRDAVQSNPNAPITRTETMSLTRTGTWPNFQWKRLDWTVQGQNPLRETLVESSGQDSGRTETIVVRSPGGGPAALSVRRDYLQSHSLIEVLAAETVGVNTGLKTKYSFYESPGDIGSLGQIKNVQMPTGGWAAYEYYPASANLDDRGGQIKYSYKPYLNSPSTISTSPTLGEVSYHEYVNNLFQVRSRPSLQETRINGTLVAKSTWTYSDGDTVTEVVRTEHTSGSASLQHRTIYYRDDLGDSFVRGRLYSSTSPDGVRQVHLYQKGTWNGSTFTNGGGVGTASRIITVTGSSLSTAGPACPSIDGSPVNGLYLVDGQSTLEVTIRDARALVVRTESGFRKNGTWLITQATNYTHDYAGRVTQKVTSNGTTSTASYVGGVKTEDVDESGIVTKYSYDAMGRLVTKARQGYGPIATLVTTYTYDTAGRVKSEQSGSGALDQRITKETTYDDAGRVVAERPPGGYGSSTHAYNVSARTHTVTRADGSTVITTNYLDGKVASVTGTGVVAQYHTYGVESSGQRWQQTNAASVSSVRWSKTWTDWAGRTVKTEAPGFTGQPSVITENSYDQIASLSAPGRLVKTTKTGYAPTLYHYNALGRVSRSGMDVDGNGRLDLASSDRITETESYLELYQNGAWLRSDTRTYHTLGKATPTLTFSRTKLAGFPTGQVAETEERDAEGNVTTTVTRLNRANRQTTKITKRSGIAGSLIETRMNGFVTSVTDPDGLTSATEYDSLLRVSVREDSRGNRTQIAYIPGTELTYTVTNQAGNQTLNTYDNMGRVVATFDPKGYATRTAYTLRGEKYRQWGSAAMPVEYGYDSYGQRVTMATYRGGSAWDGAVWPASPGTADTTTWTFHEPTGLLTAKTDALGRSATQTYNLRGQTATRVLARGATTTYSYDAATGELLTQTYSDSTPAVTFTYGRTGKVKSVTDVTGTRDFIYDPIKPWRLIAEAHDATSGSFYGGRVYTRLYDEQRQIGRVRGFQLGTAAVPTAELEQVYGYSANGRFETLTTRRDGEGSGRTFRYGYLPNSTLLQSLSIDQGSGPGGHPFTITRTYEDDRDILTSIEAKWSTTSRSKYAYVSDERGMRTSVVQSGDVFADFGGVANGATFRRFTYNGRGEVTADAGYLGSNVADDSKPLHGRRHEFEYDHAGNRQWSNRTGVPALRNDYTTNALNQYVSRENNTIAVSGTAAEDAGGAGGTAVAIGGRTVAAGRQGRYWNDEVVVSNSVAPWRGPLSIYAAKRGSGGGPDLFRTELRTAEIAAALETITYDLDGNPAADGIYTYTWDAENRLTKMEVNTTARANGFPYRIYEFKYDYMGRRVEKRVLDATGLPSVEISHRRFLYDGWSMLAEYSLTAGSPTLTVLRSYTWGLDIARSLSDAGGVGALLQIADHASRKSYLPTYDGNGNIASLLNGDSGTLATVYEYNGFGESLRVQSFDTVIADNPYRFSTKFTDVETGLVDYGRRFYDPRNGRFVGRDPVEETGGLNLYGFVRNNPINRWDYIGLSDIIKMEAFKVEVSRLPDPPTRSSYNSTVSRNGWDTTVDDRGWETIGGSDDSAIGQTSSFEAKTEEPSDPPELKLLKPGMEVHLDRAMLNLDVVAALGVLYLRNLNSPIEFSGGKEQVLEHYMAIYFTSPVIGNETFNTQINSGTPGSGVRGSVQGGYYSSRADDVAFIAHSHPPGSNPTPTWRADFASENKELVRLGFWTAIVSPTNIYFTGPQGQYYYVPASDFIDAGRASGVVVDIGDVNIGEPGNIGDPMP